MTLREKDSLRISQLMLDNWQNFIRNSTSTLLPTSIGIKHTFFSKLNTKRDKLCNGSRAPLWTEGPSEKPKRDKKGKFSYELCMCQPKFGLVCVENVKMHCLNGLSESVPIFTIFINIFLQLLFATESFQNWNWLKAILKVILVYISNVGYKSSVFRCTYIMCVYHIYAAPAGNFFPLH